MISNIELLGSIKLLASDLDGTLLDPDHHPAPGTFEAIAEFQAAGGIFAVCTGRDKGSARGVLRGLDIDRMPGVYMNGTIAQGLGGEPLQARTVPEQVIQDVVEWARTRRDIAAVNLVVGDVHYVLDKSDEWALFMHKHLHDPEPVQLEGGWDVATPALPPNVNLMRVICSPDKMDTVKPQVQELVKGKSEFAQSLPTTIDIMAPNTNKATGLHVLLSALGLTEAQTCAIGDSENDLEMLQSVRVACAMGNAVKKAKAVAHFVMPANRDNPAGVVCLLRSLTLALKSVNSVPAQLAGPKLRVACFCGGSWGAPAARMVGQALLRLGAFEEALPMWIKEEMVDGEKLTDIINRTSVNTKYMPGLRFPRNLTAVSDARAAAKDADVLVFVVPREDMLQLLDELQGQVKGSACAVIMSKDLAELSARGLRFGNEVVSERLGIAAAKTAVLLGGTLAADVARGHFAEATLGCQCPETSKMLLPLFQRPNFSVSRVASPTDVELFSTLKSIISLAAGLCDGLGYGDNTKAAVVRLGAVELSEFAARFYPEMALSETLKQACGFTDLIASSFGNTRTRRCAEAFARDPSKSWEEVAAACLRSGMPSGVSVTQNVAGFIAANHARAEFPFISKIHRIVTKLDAPATLTDMAVPRVRHSKAKKVAILGSGNWGMAIARIVAENVQKSTEFQQKVDIWVHEEIVDGQKLTDIINTKHENVKYLPGFELPPNLVAIPDPVEVVSGAAVLIFVLPHQYLGGLLDSIEGKVSQDAVAITLTKGYFEIDPGNFKVRTGSQVISQRLGLNCAMLGGANVAKDVAAGDFAEATIGCTDEENGLMLCRLFNSQQFSVRTCPDVLGVELFGSVKNIVALAAGFCDGLELGINTKAAVLRRGLLEMADFVHEIFPSSRPETLLESCGFADLLTTCFSGRNRLCAEAFARNPSKSWEAIEAELLNGQKLQGPSASKDIQVIIEKRGLQAKYPLLTSIHGAVTKALLPEDVFTRNGFLVPDAE